MKLIIEIPEEIMEYVKNNGCLSVVYDDEVAKAIINGTPYEDRPQGKWIKMSDNYGHSSYFCSRCGTQEGKARNICPNCNADMRGDKE